MVRKIDAADKQAGNLCYNCSQNSDRSSMTWKKSPVSPGLVTLGKTVRNSIDSFLMFWMSYYKIRKNWLVRKQKWKETLHKSMCSEFHNIKIESPNILDPIGWEKPVSLYPKSGREEFLSKPLWKSPFKYSWPDMGVSPFKKIGLRAPP